MAKIISMNMEKEEKIDLLIELRKEEGLNRKEFALKYEIPYPTITDWEMGHRRIPEYFLRLLAYKVRVEKGTLKQFDNNIKGNGNLFVSELTEDKITDEIIDQLLFDRMEDCNDNVDCIIVLGSIKASQYRIPIAAEAYHKKRAPKLLLCGGRVREFPEGIMKESEHMYRRAMELGVKSKDIFVENNSQNTVENMLGALMELQKEFWLNRVKKVLLVTTTYHMRRSLSIARYLFPAHIEVLPCPADDNNTRRDNWMKSNEGRERVLAEVRNIITCVENGVFPDFEI